MSVPNSVNIFIDGACRGNPGPGGWGAVLQFNEHEKHLFGSEAHTTNNRMELVSAIQALKQLKRSVVAIITTDSQYVRRGITEWLPTWKARGWKTANKDPVKNVDLWQALDIEVQRHQIEWHWVKGHSGHPGNELADSLANRAIDEMLGKR